MLLTIKRLCWGSLHLRRRGKKIPYIISIERSGIEKGKLENQRESVIEVLEAKFNTIPPELKDTINNLEDISFLKQLHRDAIFISRIEDF